MNYDSLKEQAEQLGLLKYITDENFKEDSIDDIKEEVKEQEPRPKSSKNSAIKKKKKRIEDDIEKLKIQKYNQIREYTQKKTQNKGSRKHGPRVKENKITEIANEHDSQTSTESKTTGASSDKKHPIPPGVFEASFTKNKGSKSSKEPVTKPRASSFEGDSDSTKDRVLKNKQRKKLEEQKKQEQELMEIYKQNQATYAEARMREKNMYNHSGAMKGILTGEKKIEEEYSLYDHPVDDDQEDEYLESIIEEADAEDEEDKEFKENLKAIDEEIHNKKKKLEEIGENKIVPPVSVKPPVYKK